MLKSMLAAVCLFVGVSSNDVIAQDMTEYTCQVTEQVSMEPCSCCSYTQAIGISVVTKPSIPTPAPPCVLAPDDATIEEKICNTYWCIAFRDTWPTCGGDPTCELQLLARYLEEVENCSDGIARVGMLVYEFDFVNEFTDGNMKQALTKIFIQE